VDDDRDIREALDWLLREKGYRTATAANGWEALVWLRDASQLPFLILLDLMMPVLDGWQFLRQCQQDPLLATVPVWVLSAHYVPEEVVGAGAARFLAKPLDLDHLLGMIVQLRPI